MVEEPFAVLVDGVPPDEEPQLVGREPEPLPRARAVRLDEAAELVAGPGALEPGCDLEAERQGRLAWRQRREAVSRRDACGSRRGSGHRWRRSVHRRPAARARYRAGAGRPPSARARWPP